jgi:hypothetical protein
MEPKDLKNSTEELNGAPVSPETVSDQNVVEESVVRNPVAETVTADREPEKAVAESDQSTDPEPEETTSRIEETQPLTVAEAEEAERLEPDEAGTIGKIHVPESPEGIDPEPVELVAEAETEAALSELPDQAAVAKSGQSEENSEDAQADDETDDDDENQEPKVQTANYADLSEVELINALKEILEKGDFENAKDDIDAIKIYFYRKHRAKVETERKLFVEAGGKPEEFQPEEDPYEADLRNLLKQYQDLRIEHNRRLDEEKEINLEKKYEIIEEIKALINNKESINKTFHEFRDLQNRWREIGPVPQTKLKDLWDTYHHHVENFYDYIKINKELRDMDLKKNLETKIEICEKTEELLVEPSIIKAFNILQKYHEQWREVGPVPRDKKDELWERFKAATSIINKKHQDYFEGRKSEQKKNLDAKIALCEKVEEIANSEIESHREWDDKSKELIELQKLWRTIGFAPKKDNNRIYERFRLASDKFFDRKREFYNQNKEEQQNNLQLKTDLCIQAEALKDSTDWKKTADEFIEIQKNWKQIGPVPRKYSDAIWKRFRAACDYFFENKSKHFSSVDSEQVENLKRKKELLEEVRNFSLTGDDGADLDNLKDFQRRFTEIGHVPYKEKDNIQNEFRDLINKHFDALRIDEKRRNLMKFKSKVVNSTGTPKGQNKMRFEREKYMNKLKQMENDLALLDNNVGFFANTKNAEALIEDVNQKISVTKEKIELLKEKIRIMDSMEDEGEN